MSKKFKNPDHKYYELIFDLEGSSEFISEIYTLRKKLGLPQNGLEDKNAESAFFKKHKITLEPREVIDIEKEYKHNKKELSITLEWNNLPAYQQSILDKYKLPRRANFPLYFYILFGNKPVIFSESNLYRIGFEVDVQMHMFSNGDKVSDLQHDDDVAAVIFVYPNATREDIRLAIKDNWSIINIAQKEILKRMDCKKIRVTKKTSRSLQDKILKLHRKGLTSPQISKELNIKSDGAFEYVRSVKSRRINRAKIQK